MSKHYPNFAIGAHRTAGARQILGQKWIKPFVPYAIVGRRGDHFVQVNHDASGFNVCNPNGMSQTYYDVNKAMEHMQRKVP